MWDSDHPDGTSPSPNLAITGAQALHQVTHQLLPPSGIDAGREARESNAEPSSDINAAGTGSRHCRSVAGHWRQCGGWSHGATATRGLEVGMDHCGAAAAIYFFKLPPLCAYMPVATNLHWQATSIRGWLAAKAPASTVEVANGPLRRCGEPHAARSASSRGSRR